jgi:hypothetical protein
MSKRHQASRRRVYGRRQHELHERTDRLVGVMDWLGESELPATEQRWHPQPSARGVGGNWLALQGID